MLEGKVILITGSSRGIGAATAKLAKDYGASVVLHGRTESDELKKLAQELDTQHIACDVTDEKAVKKAVDQVLSKQGKIDVLVNSVGIATSKLFLEATSEIWLDLFKVNVLGTVNFCKAVIPAMQAAEYGRIVNIASIRGHSESAGKPAYSASKAAIINLTTTLAKEFAPHIAVNAVSPGFTNTEMTQHWTEAVWAQTKTALTGRVAEPGEIGEAILFLASDRASFITGQTILVDGGYSISGK